MAQIRSIIDDRRPGTLADRIGVTLSGLCLMHCIASAIFFASVASIGAVMLNPLFHEIGLVLAIGFGLFALVRGTLDHGHMLPFGVGCTGIGMMAGGLAHPHGEAEVLATMIGVVIVALAHDLNLRAAR